MDATEDRRVKGVYGMFGVASVAVAPKNIKCKMYVNVCNAETD